MTLAKREPWEQRLDEPDFCFRQFEIWLQATPRTAPNDSQLAAAYSWAERAIAYDNSRDIPTTPAERVQRILDSGTAVCCIELGKLLVKSRENLEPTLTVRELTRLADVIVGLPAKAAGLPTEQHVHIPADATIEQINELIKTLRGIKQ